MRRARLSRVAATAGATALLALSLTACGGGADSAPEDASSDDFCTVSQNPPEDMQSDDSEVAADAAHQYADDLKEVGTPSEFDDDARAGFVVITDFLADVSAGDVEDLASAEESDVFSAEELKQITAFSTAGAAACGAPDLGDLGSDLGSDLPDPGDLASELPTDFPS